MESWWSDALWGPLSGPSLSGGPWPDRIVRLLWALGLLAGMGAGVRSPAPAARVVAVLSAVAWCLSGLWMASVANV